MTAKPATISARTVVIGQESVRRQLSESVKEHRVAHAYLFTGPGGVGKTAVALEFVQLLLCDQSDAGLCGQCPQCQAFRVLQHPDLRMYFPLPTRKSSASDDEEKEFAASITKVVHELARDRYAPTAPPNAREIRLPLIRSMLRSAALKPYQAQRKVFLILQADTMNEQAQNALLKLLEEPYAESYFLLVTDNEQGLRPTIRSRCQRVRFAPLAATEIEQALVAENVPQSQASLAARLAGGSFVHARALAGPDIEILQKNVVEFLRAAWKGDPFAVETASAGLLETGALPVGTGLEMLGQFLRDAALARASASGTEGRIAFRNLAESVLAFSAAYPQANFEAAAAAVDESATYLERGYTKEMIFYALAIRLSHALGPLSRSRPAAKAIHHD